MSDVALRICHGLHKASKPRDNWEAARYDKKQLVVLMVDEFIRQCQEMGYTFRLVITKHEDVVVALWNGQYYGQLTSHAIQYFIRTACDTMFDGTLFETFIWGDSISSRTLVRQFKSRLGYSDFVSNLSK